MNVRGMLNACPEVYEEHCDNRCKRNEKRMKFGNVHLFLLLLHIKGPTHYSSVSILRLYGMYRTNSEFGYIQLVRLK